MLTLITAKLLMRVPIEDKREFLVEANFNSFLPGKKCGGQYIRNVLEFTE